VSQKILLPKTFLLLLYRSLRLPRSPKLIPPWVQSILIPTIRPHPRNPAPSLLLRTVFILPPIEFFNLLRMLKHPNRKTKIGFRKTMVTNNF
jgi:hypothetical protein